MPLYNMSGNIVLATPNSQISMADSAGVEALVMKINASDYTEIRGHNTSWLIVLAAGNGTPLLYLNGNTNQIIIPPGSHISGEDSGYNAGNILYVDSGGNTILQAHPTLNVIELVDSSGNVIFSTSQSASAPALATGDTITTIGVGMARVAPTGNVTSVILQAGVTKTQEVLVVNESSFTITFAAVGTSNVADGISAVIAANRSMFFTWNSVQSKWYHS